MPIWAIRLKSNKLYIFTTLKEIMLIVIVRGKIISFKSKVNNVNKINENSSRTKQDAMMLHDTYLSKAV